MEKLIGRKQYMQTFLNLQNKFNKHLVYKCFNQIECNEKKIYVYPYIFLKECIFANQIKIKGI